MAAVVRKQIKKVIIHAVRYQIAILTLQRRCLIRRVVNLAAGVR